MAVGGEKGWTVGMETTTRRGVVMIDLTRREARQGSGLEVGRYDNDKEVFTGYTFIIIADIS
jgi:hypothetical protein